MKGNKGEWSELYTFFKLLSEGKMFSADENLERTDSFVELLSIFRKDKGQNLSFEITTGSSINIVDANTNEVLLSFLQSEAKNIADSIVKDLKGNLGISDTLKSLIKNYYITQVADKSTGKGDINVLIYDPVHGISSNQEFSIKSFLGSKPTLFNSNQTTNIIYAIYDENYSSISESHLLEVNSITDGHKYINRMARLKELGYNIDFDSYEDDTFKLNLQLIDSDLPKIIAHIVKDKYVRRITKITNVIAELKKDNPMNYDQTQGHEFYEYKIVKFLVEAALGMTSKAVWSGKYDIVGGIVIVKPNAEILCYHLIDFNKFKYYLKNASKLDNPSGSKMNYGKVYMQDGKSFINLNFQIKA